MKRLLTTLALLCALAAPLAASEVVILLHGLMRSDSAMNRLETAADQAGFLAINIGYDSLSAPIESLAISALLIAILLIFLFAGNLALV